VQTLTFDNLNDADVNIETAGEISRSFSKIVLNDCYLIAIKKISNSTNTGQSKLSVRYSVNVNIKILTLKYSLWSEAFNPENDFGG
jgi:hypothetical protein